MAEKSLNTILILRNDETTAWEASERVLKKGEVGLEYREDGSVMIKAGNDEDVFADLKYVGSDVKPAQVFQVELGIDDTDDIAAIEEEVGEKPLSVGDIAIVKAGIVGDYTSYTSYVYDGANWVATDGNYSANNVFLKEDITLAGEYTQVGNLTKTKNGTGTFATAGISVADALKKMLTATLQPKITANPAANVKLHNGTSYVDDNIVLEVGSTFTPNYSASLSAGSYTYGPSTGITAKTWTVTDTNGNSATTASGTFDSFTVTDSTSYKITAKATHDAGPVAKDNLGDPSSPEIKIGAADSTNPKSDTTGTVSGYRAWFYGYKGDTNKLDVNALDSDDIRGLSKSNGSIPASITTDKMKQMFFAIPNSKGKTTIAVANSTNGAPQTVTGPVTVYVKGNNNYMATGDETTNGGMKYDVWYVNNASAESGSTTFNITVS
jgi:hypothetical protein